MYKIKHIPTGLYFTPSRESGNLSKSGKIYANEPSITRINDWTSNIRIKIYTNGVNYRETTKLICKVFDIPLRYMIDTRVNTLISDWIVEPVSKKLDETILTEEWFLERPEIFQLEPIKDLNHSNMFSVHMIDYKYSFAYADFRGDWAFYHSYTDAHKEEENNRFDFISCGMKYVHEIQNLLYALTLDKSYLHI